MQKVNKKLVKNVIKLGMYIFVFGNYNRQFVKLKSREQSIFEKKYLFPPYGYYGSSVTKFVRVALIDLRQLESLSVTSMLCK